MKSNVFLNKGLSVLISIRKLKIRYISISRIFLKFVNFNWTFYFQCRLDLTQNCLNAVQPGEELQCLQENFDNLQEECHQAIQQYTEMEAKNENSVEGEEVEDLEVDLFKSEEGEDCSEGYDDDEGSFAVIMVAKVKMAAQTEAGAGGHFLPN